MQYQTRFSPFLAFWDSGMLRLLIFGYSRLYTAALGVKRTKTSWTERDSRELAEVTRRTRIAVWEWRRENGFTAYSGEYPPNIMQISARNWADVRGGR